MLKEFNHKLYNGALDFSIVKKQSLIAIVSFLDQHLYLFPSTLQPNIHKEDEITQECETYLNIIAREKSSLFHFRNQHKYKNSNRSSDLAVIIAKRFSSTDPLFVIEAKRLPTPPPKAREKEYVIGNLGGIERFKRCYHANNLPVSAMLGYIQKEDYTYWLKNINSWIKDLILNNKDNSISWGTQDILIENTTQSKVKQYHSTHKRIDNTDILIHHFWLKL